METNINKKSQKSQKSLEDYAFEAWMSLNAYRHSLWNEFFRNCDPLDPDYPSMRTSYYDTYDYVTDMMHHLDELPNPFDNVL